MKFLQKMFHYDPTASIVEKAVTVLVPIAAIALLLWLMLASYGVGNSNLAKAHEAAKPNAAIWATLLYAAAIFWAWWNWTDRIPFRVNDIVATLILLILLVLAVNANTAFFTYVY